MENEAVRRRDCEGATEENLVRKIKLSIPASVNTDQNLERNLSSGRNFRAGHEVRKYGGKILFYSEMLEVLRRKCYVT